MKAAFEEGAQDKDHLSKFRHAIIFELNRLGIEKSEIKIKLLEWNKKSYQVLSTGDARRKLCDYVDWFFKHECKLSCKGLEDYCVFQNGGCCFKRRPYQENIELPFSISEANNFLMTECKPHGYLMDCLIKILFEIQQEKGVRDIVFVGLRTLKARLSDEYRRNLDPKDILRTLSRLEENGFIRITHGKRGTFSNRANGYAFLPWTRPLRIITHMCGNSETH